MSAGRPGVSAAVLANDFPRDRDADAGVHRHLGPHDGIAPMAAHQGTQRCAPASDGVIGCHSTCRRGGDGRPGRTCIREQHEAPRETAARHDHHSVRRQHVRADSEASRPERLAPHHPAVLVGAPPRLFISRRDGCRSAVSLVYYGLSMAIQFIPGSLYTKFLYTIAIEFPAIIFYMLMVDRVGRKPLFAWGFVLGGFLDDPEERET